MKLLLVGLAAAAGSLVYTTMGGGPVASGFAAVVRFVIRNAG